jgi:tRNA G18 (ribose-2'-O)-methylase SpoU
MTRLVAEHIETPEDPRIAPFRGIRERDLHRTGDGRFIVEGRVALDILLRRSRFPVESVLIRRSRLAGLEGLLRMLPEGVPLYVAEPELMSTIAGFPIHRGILACASKIAPQPSGMAADARTVLMLNGLSNHDNVGAAFRNAAAFGVDLVLLDHTCCDPLYRKAIRVSAGTSLWLPYRQGGTGAEQISELRSAGFEIWGLTPSAEASKLSDMTVPPRLALLLGPEGPGLSGDLLRVSEPVRIPMAKGVDSLNVATAGAVVLNHVFTQRRASVHRP